MTPTRWSGGDLSWRPSWDGRTLTIHGPYCSHRLAADFRRAVLAEGGTVEMVDGYLLGVRHLPYDWFLTTTTTEDNPS